MLAVRAQPAHGESLPSWVDRTAAINGVQRRHMWYHLGLIEDVAEMPVAYGVTLTPNVRTMVEQASGIAEVTIDQMLLSRYAGTAMDMARLDLNDRRTVAAWARTAWAYIWASRACPACLRDSPGVWHLRWKTPWAFVCPDHQAYLIAICPDCGARLQSNTRDGRQQHLCCGSVPETGRGRVDGKPRRRRHTNDICGLEIGQAAQQPADRDAVLLQRRVDMLFDSANDSDTRGKSRQRLTELRSLLTFVLYIGVPGMLSDADPLLRDRFIRHVAVRDAQVPRKGSQAQEAYRSYTLPPSDPLLIAAAVTVAGRLAFADNVADACRRFVDQASGEMPDCKARWRQLDKFWRPPDRFAYSLREARDRHLWAVSASLDGRSQRRHPTARVDSRHVPALMWPDAYSYLSDDVLRAGWEIPSRRFCALALARTVEPALNDWATAAAALGLPEHVAAHCYLLTHRMRADGTGELFHHRLTALTETLNSRTKPIDYRRRRSALTSLTDVPGKDWANVCDAHGFDPHSPKWQRHRVHAAAWLWATLTGGDWHHAPSLGLAQLPAKERRLTTQRYNIYFQQQQLPKIETGMRKLAQTLLRRHRLTGAVESTPFLCE
ncbi:TniQ family protein [Nucisporomicrobium flavum]|uniref:TniQ family protein n=1 Tax=Nucisporomicrobium flavum TaxID=2785915 RepID=UPI0018F2B9F0|nr:TniQ family protein [Nucisporomicrobium flavum]